MRRILLALTMLTSHTTCLFAEEIKLRCEPYSRRGSVPLFLTIDTRNVSIKAGDETPTYYIDGRKSQRKIGKDEPGVNRWTACIYDETEYVSVDASKIRFGKKSVTKNTCGWSDHLQPPGKIEQTNVVAFSIDKETGFLSVHNGYLEEQYKCKVPTGKVIP